MDTFDLTETNADLEIAAKLLKRKEIVAFPTETVYGLGVFVDCLSFKKLFQLKKRANQKPLSLHISSLEFAYKYIENVDRRFLILAKEFFPGPLTLVVKAKKEHNFPFISDRTIGIRYPANETALRFIDFCGGAIFATSANLSNKSPSLSFDEVKTVFAGKIAAIIKERNTVSLKKPSTVISLVDKLKVLRKGAVSEKEILKVLQKHKLHV